MSVGSKERVATNELLRLAGIKTWQLLAWVQRDLVPGWCGRELYGGQGSRYWYPPETLELCRKVKAWREQGIPYRQIRELLRAEGAEV